MSVDHLAGDVADFRIRKITHEFSNSAWSPLRVGVREDDDFAVGLGGNEVEAGGLALAGGLAEEANGDV